MATTKASLQDQAADILAGIGGAESAALRGEIAAFGAASRLGTLSEAERATLVATRTEDGYLQHDIHLQGDKETVFLAY